jgi:DNA-binding response OmpR family regulator
MCDVVKASTFDEGKEHLESQKFDLAILDIMGVDGYRSLKMANEKGAACDAHSTPISPKRS